MYLNRRVFVMERKMRFWVFCFRGRASDRFEAPQGNKFSGLLLSQVPRDQTFQLEITGV